MRPHFSGLFLIPFLLTIGSATQAKTNPETLARAVLSEDANEADSAIAELRTLGPEGLRVLFQVYADDISRETATSELTAQSQRLNAALDAVSQQKDSYLSGLYWYTDMAQARAAARATGKPILSLRLLGKLNEEFSCANSRFFRAVLYSNTEVSKILRERFILHWQTVRPAPRVTIDFGDGRKLEGTITGNSIHYVLDAEGQPLDALPGLYGPQAFLRSLAQIQEVHERVKGLGPEARARTLDDYHRAAVRSLTQDWIKDAEKAGGKIPEYLIPKATADGNRRAVEIAPLAITKRVTEVNLLRAITRDADALGVVTDEVAWTRIALQHILDAKLDDQSIGLIRRQTQRLLAVRDSSAITPEMKLMNMVQKLQLSIALDTVRNEYMLRPKLHAWLVADPVRFDVDKLNEKVYAELFLTPKTDPWLGLFSPETYMALERGGVAP